MFNSKKQNRRNRRRAVNTDVVEIVSVLFLAATIVSLVAFAVYF